ncbi:hypothetical protein [Phaeobacter porticola]|uniref:Uncharacterized protein n=1 Tax=Phaeobacter porticola TaxID=1844006 RepID=A0A1L3I362_9RHOB|nr:hypothetical protein [Phaeobacter porticola]APG46541.1 hypothetical protein PhaeoP97_01114 [Phaeobacter porticola]
MGIEQILRMILRRVIGRAVNAGINSGINALSKRGKSQRDDKDSRPLPQDKEAAKKARLMRRNMRPPRL